MVFISGIIYKQQIFVAQSIQHVPNRAKKTHYISNEKSLAEGMFI